MLGLTSQLDRDLGLGSDAVRQTDIEGRFQPREKFHTFEAAEAQIAIELRGQTEHRQRALTAQFFEQAAEHFHDAFAHRRVVELGDGSGHRTQEEVRILPREATMPKRRLPSTSDKTESSPYFSPESAWHTPSCGALARPPWSAAARLP